MTAAVPQKLIALNGDARIEYGIMYFPVVLDGAEFELACGFPVAIELVKHIQRNLMGRVLPWPDSRRPKPEKKAPKRKAPATEAGRRR